MTTYYKHVQGGGVPGGHCVIVNEKKGTAFVPQMGVCHAIELRHTDVVVDIGAYVGTFALTAARFPVREVIAYEPTPRSFAVMQLNRQLVNLQLRRAAIVRESPPSGEINFYLSDGIGVRNTTRHSDRKRSIRVPAVAYRDAVRTASVVKIDVEGAEYDFADEIVQPSLRALFVEFHHIGRDWIDRAQAIAASFVAQGFETVVAPKYDRGFSCAGAWRRDVRDPAARVCSALMCGERCCGCGAALLAAHAKALCETCFAAWRSRHREGYALARAAQLSSAEISR
jgi:FkbM family methyltransferase